MPQMKSVQLFLQNFKNVVAYALTGAPTIGGTSPFAVVSVKPIVKLFKEKIYDFFFPELGPRHGEF